MTKYKQHDRSDGEAEVQTVRPTCAEPPKYKVVLLNDDYTPMDFVVEILKKFFCMNHNAAINTMLQVHIKGKAVCGIYVREIAETKVQRVNDFARFYQYPLMCQMEID